MTFALGGIAGGLILGCYLFISVQIFGRHSNEAFSSLRIADFKQWVRLKIDSAGRLTIYSIAIDRVPRRWRVGERNGVATDLPDDPLATAPRLVDRVQVRLAR
jgi:hypothetical protein